MMPQPHILGVVLAGGEARRMGGGDKGMADLAGQTLLQRVLNKFSPQVSRTILNANGDAARFAEFTLEVLPDLPAHAGQGPLAGFLAAMDWAQRHHPAVTAIATVTTDVPFLPADLIARLSKDRADGPAIATSGGRTHPAIGLWPVALRDKVATALDHGQRSVHAFAEQHEAIAISFPFSDIGGRTVDPFFNANTPDDLAAARALLTGQP